MPARDGGDDGGVVVDGSNRPLPTDSAPTLTSDTVLDGRYRLKTPVSSRGPVTLWRGDDEVLARAVAVRVVEHPDGGDPERARAARLLLDAAINSGRLVHPGAASTYDATTTISDIGQVSYVVSEWVDGRTLRQMATGGTMPPGQAAAVVLAAARVVAAAHDRGIHHGDLDPGNVIVSPHNTVKVVDIETAGVLAALDNDRPATGRDPKRADVEALGGLLYAALTGSWPLPGDCGLPAAPAVDGKLRSPRQVRSGVPRDLDAVTLATLGDSRAAGTEISTAAELVDELAAIAPGDAVFDPGLVSFGDAGATTGTQVMSPPPTEPAYSPSPPPRLRPPTGYPPPPAYSAPPPAQPPAARRPAGGEVRRRSGGPRPLPILAAVAVLAVLGVILAVVIPGFGSGGGAATPSSSTSASAPADGGGGGSGGGGSGSGSGVSGGLTPVASQAFDPPPGGDGNEKGDRVRLALDGNPATAWETEGYVENMGPGGIKPGVGFLLDYGRPISPREIRITFAGGPTSFELRAGDVKATTIGPYAVQASANGVNGSTAVPITSNGAHQYWVVWLTSLPSAGGGYRGAVVDMMLRS
jgi:hypothetical protein